MLREDGIAEALKLYHDSAAHPGGYSLNLNLNLVKTKFKLSFD